MRMWQLILELLIYYTPMADSLHLCFPLGHSGRLPLVVCCFLLSWSRFAKNRIVLGNVSWHFGPSSFILGYFFLLGMGLGLDMKWVGVAKFFDPTIAPKNPVVQLLGRGGFWCHCAGRRILMSLGLCHGRSSLVPRECQSLFACPRHVPGVLVYKAHRH